MKRKKDWVDKMIDSGLTGHAPKRKKVRRGHKCRFDRCEHGVYCTLSMGCIERSGGYCRCKKKRVKP